MHTATTFLEVMERVAQGFEVLAVVLLVVGLVASLGVAGTVWVRSRAGQLVILRDLSPGSRAVEITERCS